jgi:hypothetical protein
MELIKFRIVVLVLFFATEFTQIYPNIIGKKTFSTANKILIVVGLPFRPYDSTE